MELHNSPPGLGLDWCGLHPHSLVRELVAKPHDVFGTSTGVSLNALGRWTKPFNLTPPKSISATLHGLPICPYGDLMRLTREHLTPNTGVCIILIPQSGIIMGSHVPPNMAQVGDLLSFTHRPAVANCRALWAA